MTRSNAVALLANRYPGAVAARGLWLWAGGREADVTYADAPETQWEALWTRASEPDAGATRVALLRECLFDAPGDAELISALETLSDAALADPARELVDVLEAVLDGELDDAALWIALGAFPAPAFEQAYPVLVRAFDGRLATVPRERIETSIQRIAVPSFADAVASLCRVLWAAPVHGFAPAAPNVPRLDRALRELPGLDLHSRLSGLDELLARVEPFTTKAPPDVRRTSAGLVRRLRLLRTLALGDAPPEQDGLRKALVAALWSTRAGNAA